LLLTCKSHGSPTPTMAFECEDDVKQDIGFDQNKMPQATI